MLCERLIKKTVAMALVSVLLSSNVSCVRENQTEVPSSTSVASSVITDTTQYPLDPVSSEEVTEIQSTLLHSEDDTPTDVSTDDSFTLSESTTELASSTEQFMEESTETSTEQSMEESTEASTEQSMEETETETVTESPTSLQTTSATTEASSTEEGKELTESATSLPTESPTPLQTESATIPVTMTGIEASVTNKTRYIGDSLSASDFKVYGIYSDGTQKTVSGWSASPLKLMAATNSVTVTYGSFTKTITVAAVEKHTHTYTEDKSQYAEPTCTTAGKKVEICSCGSKVTEIAALGHNFVFTNKVPPTKTTEGYDLYICTRCQATEKRNQAAKLPADAIPISEIEGTFFAWSDDWTHPEITTVITDTPNIIIDKYYDVDELGQSISKNDIGIKMYYETAYTDAFGRKIKAIFTPTDAQRKEIKISQTQCTEFDTPTTISFRGVTVDARIRTKQGLLGYEQDMLCFEYQNSIRIRDGKAPLAWDDKLYALACARAKEIATTGFNHNGAFGYENIVWFSGSTIGGSPEWRQTPQNLASWLISGWDKDVSPAHYAVMASENKVSGAIATYTINRVTYCVGMYDDYTLRGLYVSSQYNENAIAELKAQYPKIVPYMKGRFDGKTTLGKYLGIPGY